MRLWNSQAGYVNHVYSELDIVFENSSSGCTKRVSTTAEELLARVKELLILYTIMGVALLSIYIAS